MYRPKKPIAAVCAAALLLSPTGALGATAQDFVDFPDDWSAPALTAAIENGLLSGVGADRIAPADPLSRAQMATIINRAFATEKAASLAGYSDVPADAWYANDMAKAVQMGTFVGAGGGLLRPDSAITRQEAFSVLARAFALPDGDAAVLDSYSDGDTVSDWAKGTVSAMVAAGYVNGDDAGRLNPTKTITRAEFAAVMDNLVSAYVDADDTSEDGSVDGGVIVRESGVRLEGLTINGDLIIADEADAVSLDGVTVNGRIVVRGAADRLSISESTASGIVVTNPNGASVIDADAASSLGTLTAAADLTLQGGRFDEVVVSEDDAELVVENGASVDAITIDADGVSVSGDGKVAKVSANGSDIAVTVKGAEVTAAESAENVTAGGASVTPGETVTVGSTTTDGTKPGNGSSVTPGGGTTTPDDPDSGETESASLVETEGTRLVDLGWSQYVAITFADGHSLDDCTLSVDGQDISDAVTPVSDDGSIVKWEITSLQPAQLTIERGNDSQTVTLSDNAEPVTPTVQKDTAPDYMIAHGAVAVWDYHLTNYDDNGNVRIEPAKTTFSLSGETATDVPAFYSADAEISEDGQGTVILAFAQESDADKAWFEAVPANAASTVSLVSYDERKTTLNDDLTYTKNDDGTITIALGQDNFRSNGRYYVRVKAQGHDTALVPVHIVNAKAPSLQLTGSGSAIQSGQNVRFAIKDMVYGITNPTYAAELTRPDGTTVMLEEGRDWYQIGDTLVLYNDTNNNIPYNGSYTLTVHANGFKDMSVSFSVSGGEAAPAAARAMDAVSRATSTGSGEDSTTMAANLKFDADLLANAQLLVQLDRANDAAKGIADRWEYDMAGWDTVHSADGTAYSWTDYINTVNDAEANGDYLSFSEYIQDADKDSSGTPYAIKSVLEDNLLGETQQNGSWIGQNPPALTLVDAAGERVSAVSEGSDAIIRSADAGYLDALESITINNNALDLDKNQYNVDGDTLTISADALSLGETNSVVLYASGYKDARLSIRYDKALEEDLSLSLDKATYQRTERVTITVDGSDGDFLTNLSAVTIHKPDGSTASVGPKGYYSSDEYYEAADNTLTIIDSKGTLFDQDGSYTVTLEAKYYNQLTSPAFEVTAKAEEGPGEGAETTAAPHPDGSAIDDSGDVLLYFPDLDDDTWKDSISVSVNGTEYAENTDLLFGPDANEFKWVGGTYGGSDLKLDPTAFTEDVNTITIAAPGYETLTVTVDRDGNIVEDGDPGDTSELKTAPQPLRYEEAGIFSGAKLIFNESGSNDDANPDAFLSAITSVSVNGTAYAPASGWSLGDNEYAITTGTDAALELGSGAFKDGEANTITITADGYEDLTLTISADGNIVEDAGDQPVEQLDAPQATAFEWDNFTDEATLYFDLESDEAEVFLGAVTGITIDGEACHTYNVETAWGHYITFDGAIAEGIAATIVISADGYNDLTVTIDKDGNIIDPDAKLAAPANTGFEWDNLVGEGTLYFANESEEASAYLEAITGVSVNGNALEETPWGSPDNGEYLASASNYLNYLSFRDSRFSTDGQNTLIITADGYEDLTLTVSADGVVDPGDQPEETLKTLEVESGERDMWGNYILTFTDEAALDAFFASDNISISVNGTAFSESWSSYLWDNEYYLNKNDDPHVIELATNAFYDDRDSTITINADGFETLTVTVDKDGHIAG